MVRDIDALATYETAGALVLAMQAPTRYAVRQVLDQELQRTIAQRENAARQARLRMGGDFPAGHQHDFGFDDKENLGSGAGKEKMGPATSMANVKRDFFGRVIVESNAGGPLGEVDGNATAGGGRRRRNTGEGQNEKGKVWVTFHEGLNNAVRKPISLEEFLRGF